MTKISFDPEQGEVQVTRNLKTGDGQITINREGGGSIEINLGVGSIGLTTDYGGAISLGIAGQNVTWGREGGTIHIQIGGFEVNVEARDCIVTEIKSIYGNIVAQRSYPDPGCKLPDPPNPLPPSPPPSPEQGLDIPNLDVDAYVLVGSDYYGEAGNGFSPKGGGYKRTNSSKGSVKAKDLPGIVPRLTSTLLPFDCEGKRLFHGTFIDYGYPPVFDVTSGALRTEHTVTGSRFTSIGSDYWDLSILNLDRVTQVVVLEAWGATHLAAGGGWYGYCWIIYGKLSRIKSYIDSRRPGLEATKLKLIVNDIIRVGGQSPASPFLPTGNKPPMKDCCEEILDYLADVEEALDVQRLLKEKFPVSNSFMAPECDPGSVTTAKSFYEIMQCAFRMMAHGMIFEPRVEIKDADAAKAGDQNFKARYLNATGWASAMAEALLEVKDDGNVSTNMDIRNGFAVTQTMVGVADAIYKLEAVLDCLGVQLIPKAQTVETPYNLQIQIGKGFGEGNKRQIDLNTDEATEKLLPSFLQTQKNTIKTVDIHPRSRSLLEVLQNIEANLSGSTSDSSQQ